MYHRQLSATIGPRRRCRRAAWLAIIACLALTAWSARAAASSGNPVAPAAASASQNLFSALLALAPPGPNRASRAFDIFDRTLQLERKLAFHPELDPPLQRVRDQLPPRQSTLIRASALYSRSDISWSVEPPDRKLIAVEGHPQPADYLYSLRPKFIAPEQAGDFAGEFMLRPAAPLDGAGNLPSSVIGELGGQIYPGTFAAGALVDTAAAALAEIHGDPAAAADSAPATWNPHDAALWAHLERDLPATTERLKHYLDITNLVDEFATADGPVVLVNLDCAVKLDALKPYVHLWKFYRANAPLFEMDSMLDDEHGHNWMHVRFDRGRIQWQFMLRAGQLIPFDGSLKAAGPPLDIAQAGSGHYRTTSSARVHKLATEFGLANIVFATDYQRRPGAMMFHNRMAAAPELIAPPVVNAVMRMITGEFMRTLAEGNGGQGLVTELLSTDDPRGGSTISGHVQGEFHYSPTLEFLARIGDSIADAHNQAVRTDERHLGEELFNAFVSDYNSARAKLLNAETQKVQRKGPGSDARGG